jgi:hypothetical protein
VGARQIELGPSIMITNHTHPKDCPDQKAAASDRNQHEAARAERQTRQQILAQAEWFEWIGSRPQK